MKPNNDIIVNDSSNIQPVYINGLRIGFNEETIQIEFGSMQEDQGKQVVNIQSKIFMSPFALKGVIERMISAGKIYEKKYNKDIGINKFDKYLGAEKQ